ncbi:MAG: cyclic nucleotide-binding domain-containing protein [Candidatus Coatesbacteria bacterium]
MGTQLTAADVEQLKGALKDLSFLQYLSAAETEALLAGFDKAEMKKGELLIEQGTIGSIFYIVASGSVGVYRKRAFLDKQIARLGPGSYFGEMALLSRQPRSATVACEEDGVVFTLLRDTFRNVLLGNPHLAEMINRTAAKRREELVDIEISERITRSRQTPGTPA